MCVLRCVRRFRTLRKNTPWNFGAGTLWVSLICVDFCTIVVSFCRFEGLPVGCVCVALPAALQNPQKKHAPGILSMYLMCFTDFARLYMIL